mgnify:CR=1 FL=1
MDTKEIIIAMVVLFGISIFLSGTFVDDRGVVFAQGFYQDIVSFFRQLTSGYAVLSIHPVDLVNYETHLRSKAWWLTVVQSDFSDEVVGQISADDIKDSEGNQATKDLSIRMTVDNMRCEYPIKADERIYRAEWKRFDLSPLECAVLNYDNKDNECKAWISSVDGAYGYYTNTRCKVYCVRLVPEAWHGKVGDPTLQFQSTIHVTAGDETKSGTINSLDQTELKIGDYVYARWIGFIDTKESCPVRDVPDALFENNKWNLIDPTSYDYYKTKLAGMLSCWSSVESDTTAEVCVNNVNKALMQITPANLKTPSGHYAVPSGGITNGKVVLELEKLIKLPVINMYVRADWLGVSMPSGVPDIISLSSSEYNPYTGYGLITAEIKNVGNARGSFGVYAVCPQPFSTGGTEYITLEPGETGTVKIKVYATSINTKQEATCKVYAYDKANPDVKDYGYVKVVADPLLVCEEGATRCNGKVIEACENNGWKPIQTCDYMCDYVNGKATCVSPPPPKPPSIIDRIVGFFKDLFRGITMGLGTIVLFVLIIFGLYLLIDRFIFRR